MATEQQKNIAINQFIGGMNTDTALDKIGNTLYTYGRNFRIALNTNVGGDTTSLTKAAILTAILEPQEVTVTGDKITGSFDVLAVDSVGNVGALIIKQNNIWSLFRVDFVSYDNIKLTKIFNSEPYTERLPNTFTEVINIENDDVINIYIATTLNRLIVINLLEDNLNKTTEDVSSFSFYPQIQAKIDKVVSGKLKTGQVLYAYRFYKKYGIISKLSPLTKKILVIDSEHTKETGNALDTYTSIGLKLKIPVKELNNAGLFSKIGSMFDHVLIYRVWYKSEKSDAQINLITDSLISNDEDVLIVDDGSNDLAELTSSEFLSLLSMDIIPDTITSNQQYLFYANVLDKTQISVNFDSKTKSQDAITGSTDKSDAYSDINLTSVESVNHGKYLKDGSNLYHGGTGPNVQWRLISAKIPIHWDYYNEAIPNKRSMTDAEMFMPKYISNKTKLTDVLYKNVSDYSREIGVDLTNVGYDTQTTSSVLRSLKRNEVYRYGIIYYDKYGSRSDVLFMQDIRTPSNNIYPCVDGYIGTVSQTQTSDGVQYTDYTEFAIDSSASIEFAVNGHYFYKDDNIYFSVINNTANQVLVTDACTISITDVQANCSEEQGTSFYDKLSKFPFAAKIIRNGIDCGQTTEVESTDKVTIQVYALTDITTTGKYKCGYNKSIEVAWPYDEDQDNYGSSSRYDSTVTWIDSNNTDQVGGSYYYLTGTHRGITVKSDESLESIPYPTGGSYTQQFHITYSIAKTRTIEDTTADAIIDANVVISNTHEDIVVDGYVRDAQQPVVTNAQSASIAHNGYNFISISDVSFTEFVKLIDADYDKAFNQDGGRYNGMWKLSMQRFYEQFDKIPFVATIYKNGVECGQYTSITDSDNISIKISNTGKYGVFPYNADYSPWVTQDVSGALDILFTEALYRFRVQYLLSNTSNSTQESAKKANATMNLGLALQCNVESKLYRDTYGHTDRSSLLWLQSYGDNDMPVPHEGYNYVSISDIAIQDLDKFGEGSNNLKLFSILYKNHNGTIGFELIKNGQSVGGSTNVKDSDSVYVRSHLVSDTCAFGEIIDAFGGYSNAYFAINNPSMAVAATAIVSLLNTYNGSNSQTTGASNPYEILSAKPIGVKFDIKVPVSSGITSYLIVRCEKTDECTHNLMQVATSRPIWQTIQNTTTSKSALSPAYPTGVLSSHHGYVKDMFGNIASRDTNEYRNLSLLYSPEITLYPKSSLQKIDVSNAKGYLTAYVSAIFGNSVSGYNGLVLEILGTTNQYSRLQIIQDEGEDWYDMKISYTNVNVSADLIADAKLSSNGLIKYYNYITYNKSRSYDIEYTGVSSSPTWEKGFSNIQHSGSTITSGTKAYKSHTAAVRDLQFCNWVCSGDYDLRISCESSQPGLATENYCAFSYKKDDTTYDGQKEITGPGALCIVVIEKDSTFPKRIGTPPTSYIVNITHEASQFAGTSEQDRLYDIYYGFGNYGTLKQEGDYMVGSIDVFDGDTYIMPAEIPTMFKTYNFESTITTLPSALVINYVPLETPINTFFDYGLNFRNTQSRNLQFEPGEITGVSTTTRPYSQYNKIYSDNNTSIDRYNAQPIDKIYNKYGSRIFYSDKKDNGESLNNWSIIRANNYIDAETRYGDITHAISDKNTVYMWQENAFAKLAVNERSLVKDENSNSIQLGLGGVLLRVDYMSVQYGMKSDYRCALNINDTVMWGDYNRNKLLILKGGQVADLGKQLLIQNLLNSSNTFKAQTKLYHDTENGEVFILQPNKQILFNDAAQFAIAECDRDFDGVIEFNNTMYGISQKPNSVNNIKINKANFIKDSNAYISPMQISFAVNQSPQETKVFDNLMLVFERNDSNTKAENFALDKTFTFKTNLGGSSIGNTTDTLFTDRQGDIQFAIPRVDGSDYGNRLRGKWMEETITFNNPFSGLSSIMTKFRSSLS